MIRGVFIRGLYRVSCFSGMFCVFVGGGVLGRGSFPTLVQDMLFGDCEDGRIPCGSAVTLRKDLKRSFMLVLLTKTLCSNRRNPLLSGHPVA